MNFDIFIPIRLGSKRLPNKALLTIDEKPIIKYLISATFMFSLTYFIMNEFIEYKISIFEFLPQFLIYVTIAVGGYLALTYLILPFPWGHSKW